MLASLITVYWQILLSGDTHGPTGITCPRCLRDGNRQLMIAHYYLSVPPAIASKVLRLKPSSTHHALSPILISKRRTTLKGTSFGARLSWKEFGQLLPITDARGEHQLKYEFGRITGYKVPPPTATGESAIVTKTIHVREFSHITAASDCFNLVLIRMRGFTLVQWCDCWHSRYTVGSTFVLVYRH